MATCDDNRLKELLQSEQSQPRHDVLQHVEDCVHCQRRLEELAAKPDHWQDVRMALNSTDVRAHDFQTVGTQTLTGSLLQPPVHPEMLGRLGRYDVEREVGNGGMGIVLKAHDSELHRTVAIKILAPHLGRNGSARKRFAREARAAAAVVDDNVVPIYNVECETRTSAMPLLVMKYIAGGSLQIRIDQNGPLELCEVLRVGTQICRGLAAAHAQGLIHRDVKPSNILLDEGTERAMLTDFGLARAEDDACLTRTGFQPGTPNYMSPEQVRGEAVSVRSDLFSLGCVLYTACTGRPPFRAPTDYAVLRRITDDQPRSICVVNAAIPPWLNSIVIKLLAKSPKDRFDSAKQVADLLEDCLAHIQEPTLRPLPSAVRTISRPKGHRSNGKWALAAVAACLCVAFSPAFDGEQAKEKYANEEQVNTKAAAEPENESQQRNQARTNIPSTPNTKADAATHPDAPSEQKEQEAEFALATLDETFNDKQTTYLEAIANSAGDDATMWKLYEEMNPNSDRNEALLKFEKSHRRTKAGLKALGQVNSGLVPPMGPNSRWVKTAVARLSEFYIERADLPIAASTYWQREVLHPESRFLDAVLKKNPHPEVHIAALKTYLNSALEKIRCIEDDDYLALIMSEEFLNEFPPQERSDYQELTQQFIGIDANEIRKRAHKKLKILRENYGNQMATKHVTAASFAQSMSHAIERLVPGKPSPELAMTDERSKLFRLSNHKGEIVVLLFTKGDQDEGQSLATVQRLVDKFKGSPVKFVEVICEKEEDKSQKSTISTEERTWTVVREPKGGKIHRDWGVTNFPFAHVTNQEGILQPPFKGIMNLEDRSGQPSVYITGIDFMIKKLLEAKSNP